VSQFGTNLLNLTLLDEPQQLHLQFGRYFADFVQEERSCIGHFDLPLFVADRAGERTFLVAEEFRFEKAPRNRSAVNGDQRAIFARAVKVERSCQ
jgi:hypothetical protein